MTTDPELLLQRFVDQELSPDERIRFVALLGRSDALRQRTIEMERLLLSARELPRPQVPPGFASHVMEEIGPAPSVRAPWVEWLFAPRNLRWNFASAVAVAALVAVVVAGVLVRTQRPAPVSAGLAPPNAVPAPSTPVSVRLVVVQPGARSVQVAGDFNGWNPSRTPLEEVSSGAWTVTISLEPGRYEYMFLIDGQQWMADPFALEHREDGFGSRNAVLEVRPAADAVGAL